MSESECDFESRPDYLLGENIYFFNNGLDSIKNTTFVL